MNNNPYIHIAELYSHLMKEIDYEGWADYLYQIYLNLNLRAKNVLEIASGNCKLSAHLNDKFPNIILTDLSKIMLSKSDSNMIRICCDMKYLPFKKEFDFIFSTFDSVNYLLTEESLSQFFNEIYNLLTDDGYFTFDASLEQNSIKNVKSLNRKGKFNDLRYRQISKYNKEKKIHYNKFVMESASGDVIEEVHKQKIFDFFTYFNVSEKCGLTVKYCYDAFSFEDANINSERAQFILRKRI